MGATDKVYFLERIKTTPMTRAEIQMTFDIAPGTAVNWSKSAGVIPIEGTYPVQYVHETYVPEALDDIINKSGNSEYIKLLPVTESDLKQMEQALTAILEGENILPDFNEKIMKSDSIAKCDKVEKILLTVIMINRLNKAALTD